MKDLVLNRDGYEIRLEEDDWYVDAWTVAKICGLVRTNKTYGTETLRKDRWDKYLLMYPGKAFNPECYLSSRANFGSFSSSFQLPGQVATWLLLRSNTKEALMFQCWINDEVLPAYLRELKSVEAARDRGLEYTDKMINALDRSTEVMQQLLLRELRRDSNV